MAYNVKVNAVSVAQDNITVVGKMGIGIVGAGSTWVIADYISVVLGILVAIATLVYVISQTYFLYRKELRQHKLRKTKKALRKKK